MSTDLVVSEAGEVYPALTVNQALERQQMLKEYTQKCMVKGVDYGIIPGTGKDTLFKPGAEKLCTLFGLSADLELVREVMDWSGKETGGKPLFMFHYRYRLSKGDRLICAADGIASSAEKSHARKDPVEIVNTVCKMAQKRALVAAVLIAVNASQYYTQDLEDMPREAVQQAPPRSGYVGNDGPRPPAAPTEPGDEVSDEEWKSIKTEAMRIVKSYGYDGKLSAVLEEMTHKPLTSITRLAIKNLTQLRGSDWKLAIERLKQPAPPKQLELPDTQEPKPTFRNFMLADVAERWGEVFNGPPDRLAAATAFGIDVAEVPEKIMRNGYVDWKQLPNEDLMRLRYFAVNSTVLDWKDEDLRDALAAMEYRWKEQLRAADTTTVNGATAPGASGAGSEEPSPAGPPR